MTCLAFQVGQKSRCGGHSNYCIVTIARIISREWARVVKLEIAARLTSENPADCIDTTYNANLIVICGSHLRATLKEGRYDWSSDTATLVSISTSHSPPIGKIFKFFDLVSPAIKSTSPHSSATPPDSFLSHILLWRLFHYLQFLNFFFTVRQYG